MLLLAIFFHTQKDILRVTDLNIVDAATVETDIKEPVIFCIRLK